MEECRKRKWCTYPYRYQSETPRIDELAMDGLVKMMTQSNEVDGQEEKSEIDDYAIPDDPDSLL